MTAHVEHEAALSAADVQEMLDRQTGVLELIARSAPLPEVLTEILVSLEQLMPGARCSVLLLDRERGTLHHGSAPSLPATYVAAIDGMSIGEGAGSCGTAAATNAAVVAADVRTDPRWVDFLDAADGAGLRACWSTPIDGPDGLPVGTFAVYHPQPHRPTPREQLLVDRFTHLTSVAIDQAAAELDRRARLEAETARRTAEEHSRAKSELLAAVGHEARTPIQAIVGFAELLGTMDLDDTRRREALLHIDAAAGHVMDLLTDVLDLSRIEANALPLHPEAVRLSEVVLEVFGLLSGRADQRRVELTHDLVDDQVYADRRRLRQVMLNLVGNAIRHGQPGGQVSVEVAADPASSMLTVTVTDDGPGIPPDLLPRLFTPFALADTGSPDAGSAAPDGGGEESIGLGLALAHGLAGAMGGELSVGSSSAAGTTMRLRLAQVPGPAAPPDPPAGGRP